MAKANEYFWVRFRTKSSASLGDWQWKLFAAPTGCDTIATQTKYFRDHEASGLHDNLSTESEHWRGIDWQVRKPPRHIVEAEITANNEVLDRVKRRALVLGRHRAFASSVDLKAPVKKECRQWPKCGCAKQSASKDCREPYYPSCTITYEGKTYRVTKRPVPKIEIAPEGWPLKHTRANWKVVKVSAAIAIKMVEATDVRLKEISDELSAKWKGV